MGTIAVAGGTGQIGASLVPRLRDAGESVRIISRSPRPAGTPRDTQWAVVDYQSSAGIADAVDDVDTIVAVMGGSKDANAVGALAAASAPTTHTVYLSIVGIDRLPMRYYQHKLAGEATVTSCDRPWTILRATQFHSLTETMLRGLSKTPRAMIVPRMRIQPVSAAETAQRLADLATSPARGRADDFGGPRVYEVADLARLYVRSIGKQRRIIEVSPPGKLGEGFAAHANITPEHADGVETFEDYLASKQR